MVSENSDEMSKKPGSSSLLLSRGVTWAAATGTRSSSLPCFCKAPAQTSFAALPGPASRADPAADGVTAGPEAAPVAPVLVQHEALCGTAGKAEKVHSCILTEKRGRPEFPLCRLHF